MTTFAIATLGCKVNTYESQGYESALVDKGYEQVSFKEKADVYIINTCAVTNTAGDKSRQKIHTAIFESGGADCRCRLLCTDGKRTAGAGCQY